MAWPNGYTWRREIVIDEGQVAGSANLTNFVMLFSETLAELATVGNGGEVTDADGDDIIFELGDGTQLDHEVERWSATTGEFVAWVRVPTVDFDNDTSFYIYYGNAAVTTSQQDVPGTWNGDFAGVWHLKNGTVLSAGDSTANANNGTITGAIAGAGKIDGAGAFTNDYITIGPDAAIDFSGHLFGVSLWMNPSSILGSDMSAFSQWNGAAGTEWRWAAGLYPTTGNALFGYNNNNLTNSGANLFMDGGAPISTGVWTHFLFQKDGGGSELYINGVLVDTGGAAALPAGSIETMIGANRASSPQEFWPGSLDELRILSFGVSGAVRTAGWITTEYNSQNSPGTFYAVGSPESSGGGGSILKQMLLNH